MAKITSINPGHLLQKAMNTIIQVIIIAFCKLQKPCGEVRSQLSVALDINYITQEQFDTLSSQAIEISGIIAGIMKTVNKKRK